MEAKEEEEEEEERYYEQTLLHMAIIKEEEEEANNNERDRARFGFSDLGFFYYILFLIEVLIIFI